MLEIGLAICHDSAMQISKPSRSIRTLAAVVAVTFLVQLTPTAAEPVQAQRSVAWQAGRMHSDAFCAARVRNAAEIRPMNRPFNRAGAQPRVRRWPFRRVTGNFTGTTGEIIQWAACKWGFNVRALRAQAVKESYWTQTNLGDWTTDSSRCAPRHGIGEDGRPGECPESVGMMQVRAPYFPYRIVSGAERSTAYNLDAYLAIWRLCWRGGEAWLNTVERGREYRAGDEWGCIGRWFSGRWYTQASLDYMAAVKDLYRQRIWRTEGFRNWRP
jgi:hypothetical protein